MEAALNSNLKLLNLPSLSISTWENSMIQLVKILDPEFSPPKKELKPKALKVLELIMKIRKSDLDDFRHSRFHRVLLILTTMILTARIDGRMISKENMWETVGTRKEDLTFHQKLFTEKCREMKKSLSNYKILNEKLDSFGRIDEMIAKQEGKLKELVALHGPIEQLTTPELNSDEVKILESIKNFERWIKGLKRLKKVDEVSLDAKDLELCLSLDKKRDLSGLQLYSNGKLNLSSFVDLL